MLERLGVPEDGAPDIYADGVSISAGPAGLTITLLLSQPQISGPGLAPKAVGRVRMSLTLGEALIELTRSAIESGRDMPLIQTPPPMGPEEE